MRSQIKRKASLGVKQGKGKVSRSASVRLKKREQVAPRGMRLRNAGDKISMAGDELCPSPKKDERPTCYADRVGSWYSETKSVEHRKGEGLYLTPVAVADFMAGLIRVKGQVLRIIDPAAGAGILLCAAVETLIHQSNKTTRIELVAYETDSDLIPPLRHVLYYLKCWAAKRNLGVKCKVIEADFILEHAKALSSTGNLFSHTTSDSGFDAIIANPPYFKISKSDPRAQVAATVVHGQPNIYGLFMAVGSALLHPGGEFVFITPRSFASGPYFRLFREKFFECIRPEHVHVFGSRREAFNRDDVLQENIILKGIRDDHWHQRNGHFSMIISTSRGAADLHAAKKRQTRLSTILNLRSKDKVFRLPVSHEGESILQLVDSWPGSLSKYGLNISTGPVVPFRAVEFLDNAGDVPRTHAPLLWMQHVHSMRVTWPNGTRKEQYIKNEAAARPLLVPNRNYVLLRRFSAKEQRRRLTAAPYLSHQFNSSVVGLENHLNYIHRPGGTLSKDEAYGLAALYNSSLLDEYFRSINGNTQVNATEFRTMPLPELKIIAAIGRRVMTGTISEEGIDDLILNILGTREKTLGVTKAVVSG